MVWNDFEQIHRRTRDYTAFGPFLFDRAQYDQALAALLLDLAAAEEQGD
ncbi:hypothetical protein [Actinomadura gamaensis]|uniref:Uncharacterized protein n=1 Tax=Actinomadura gamaensis TaxID=1763541 RepID=A0ABV9U3A4_9ACTN